jgi:hypothetical protein
MYHPEKIINQSKTMYYPKEIMNQSNVMYYPKQNYYPIKNVLPS